MAAKKAATQQLDVTASINKSQEFFEKNRKIILGSLLGVIVIIAGIIWYNNGIVKPNEEKASTMLSKGQEYVQENNYELALNGDNTGYIGLLKIIDQYASTDAGNLANLYAGICYANLGDAEKAVQYLEDFDGQGDQMISPMAIDALANCYADLDQIDKAISLFKKGASKADNPAVSPVMLRHAAILLESQGKTDEAKAIYEELKARYIDSAIGQDADNEIQRLGK